MFHILLHTLTQAIMCTNVRSNHRRMFGSALHFAARNGHADIAKVLLQNGADVNAGDEEKQTALHYGASKGHVEVKRSLSY